MRLHARAAARAAALDLEDVTVSISHERKMAMAVAIAHRQGIGARPVAVAELTSAWAAAHLPPRPARAHKGTFGRVLVVAGSMEYAGAALLAGRGAARAGAGVVCLATPESVGARLLGAAPELTAMLLDEEAPGLIGPAGWRRVATEARSFDALVVGPGLGRHPATQRRVRGFLQRAAAARW